MRIKVNAQSSPLLSLIPPTTNNPEQMTNNNLAISQTFGLNFHSSSHISAGSVLPDLQYQ